MLARISLWVYTAIDEFLALDGFFSFSPLSFSLSVYLSVTIKFYQDNDVDNNFKCREFTKFYLYKAVNFRWIPKNQMINFTNQFPSFATAWISMTIGAYYSIFVSFILLISSNRITINCLDVYNNKFIGKLAISDCLKANGLFYTVKSSQVESSQVKVSWAKSMTMAWFATGKEQLNEQNVCTRKANDKERNMRTCIYIYI